MYNNHSPKANKLLKGMMSGIMMSFLPIMVIVDIITVVALILGRLDPSVVSSVPCTLAILTLMSVSTFFIGASV